MSAPLSYSEFYYALEHGYHRRVLSHLKEHSIPDHPWEKPHVKSGALPALRRWEKPAAMEVMRALLERGADPNQPDSQGRLALPTWLWLTDAPREAIAALLHAGADPLRRSHITHQCSEQTAMEVCIYKQELPKLSWLLEVRPDLVRLHDATHPDPGLMHAFVHNTFQGNPAQREAMLLLLDHGGDLDLTNGTRKSARSKMWGWQKDLVSQWEDHQRAECGASALDGTTITPSGQRPRPRI